MFIICGLGQFDSPINLKKMNFYWSNNVINMNLIEIKRLIKNNPMACT